MRKALWAVVVLTLAGCAATPVATAPPAQDVAGKQFNPPPAGLAAVYFYYPYSVGPALNVAVGPRTVGELGPMTWSRVELSPGWHVMRCMAPNANNSLSLSLAPGDMRFVAVYEAVDAPTCTIRETGPEAGRAGVLAGSRALQVR
jgi:hypothetical protein